jgi:anti-sigma regulatory factor (Ser/Thr protein kinase)
VETLTSSTEDVEWIDVDDVSAAARARGAAMALGRRLGFSESRIGEIGIAATELATNLSRHAQKGTLMLRVQREFDDAAIELVAVDSGPGFLDFDALARDGASTAGTLGIGLGAIKRLASWFDAYSLPQHGTVIIASFLRKGAPTRDLLFGMTRAMRNESVCGDAWSVRGTGELRTILLCDGLGHGELAAMASRTAVRAFNDGDDTASPAALLQRLNAALRSTRGAAAAAVRLDLRQRKLTFSGVGNVAVWIDDDAGRRGLHSAAGIVGTFTKPIRELEIELRPHAVVVLHSDGLTSKWSLSAYPGVKGHDAGILAATLLRDAGIHHDDASIVVVKT